MTKLPKRNIEIEIAHGEIKKLRRYIHAPDKATKSAIAKTFDPFIQSAIKYGETPAELIPKLEHAIALDKFRPRNLSLFQLATSNDLYHINGDFDTFRPELNALFRDPARHGELRNCFNWLTTNRFDLSQQFAYDWMRRIAAHPKLVQAAKDATGQKIYTAYNKLLGKLRDDFCAEYNIDRATIYIQLVPNAKSAGFKKNDKNLYGHSQPAYIIKKEPNLSAAAWRKLQQDFKASPATCAAAKPAQIIYVILAGMWKDPCPLFDSIMETFVHEIHHVLDAFCPRDGALGPQIFKIDRAIYPTYSNKAEYVKSASELSSFEISNLFRELLQADHNNPTR